MYKPSILNVIDNDYCIGCGVCASLSNNITMEFNDQGFYQASIDQEGLDNNSLLKMASEVCPFTNESKNEDILGAKLFEEAKHSSDYIGRYNECYVGYVSEDDFRMKGSSGGLGNWMAYELFRLGHVDKVVQVKFNERTDINEPLYSFAVSNDINSIKKGSKSAYYPIEMSEILEYIKLNTGKYLITGVPCFIKSIRLLQQQNELYKERIKFTIGLVCGHLKSENYADMIGWQLGVLPKDIKSLDFRKKIEGAKAKEKGVEVKSLKDPEYIKSDIVQNIFGTNYGEGFFKLKACDYCDDVVSETADATVGDAWLPEYVNDGKGNNVLIVRNPLISSIIENGLIENRLNLVPVTEKEVVESQAGGFRHRRDGLAYRLYLKDKKNEWRPFKRVQASNNTLSRNYKRIHKVRMRIREQSHIQFQKAKETEDFGSFQKSMQKEVNKLNPVWRKAGSKVKQSILRNK